MTTGAVDGAGWLVFGLGHPDRGDDAVSLQVAGRVAGRVAATEAEAAGAAATGLVGPPAASQHSWVRVHCAVEPSALLDLLLPGCGLVVLDAVRTGAPAGTMLVRDLAREPLPVGGTPGSGHLLGLDQVLALAGTLGRLTGPVRLVGVEAAGFGHGAGLSAPVAAAVPAAAAVVLDLVGRPAGRIGACRSTIASSPAPSPPGG